MQIFSYFFLHHAVDFLYVSRVQLINQVVNGAK